jgi:transforming growth factor-beta-induced protein
MAISRFGWSRVLMLALTLAGACDDSDDTENNSEADASQAADGGGGSDAGTVDSSTSDASTGDAATAKSIVEIASGDARFSSLVAALTKAGLVDDLSGAGPFTVFAPTNDAFTAALAALGKTLDQLTADDLKPILTYHVVSGTVKSNDLKAGPVKTLSGVSAFVSTAGGAKVNNASVTSADILASNGVVHVIDKVLLPPNLVQAAGYAGSFSKLIEAVTAAGLAETLSAPTANLTVFAPTDTAFGKLSAVPSGDALKNVLLYHVVSGKVLSTDLTAGAVPTLLTGKSLTITLTGGAKVNNVPIDVVDVVTTNGVIHVVGTVLIPPS